MKFFNPIALTFISLFFASCNSSAEGPDRSLPVAQTAFAPEYETLLSKYATPGGVKYKEWNADSIDLAKLESAVKFYGDTRPPEKEEGALAWHLNAYNAAILQKMLEQYPTKGPLAGNPLFFKTSKFTLSGREVSFDTLEQKLIRPVFEEPRIHFALNCASVSCPPLHTEPFAAATLDETLDELTKRFINENPLALKMSGNTAEISKIFEWYADDFGGEDNLATYINQYRESPLPKDVKIKFQDYSWDLNEA